MRKNIVAGNWKMNLQPAEGAALVQELCPQTETLQHSGVTLIVCPPLIYTAWALSDWQREGRIEVGAQNCYHEASGAYTGEVSAAMLANLGVGYCIVGHSERRSLFGETDEVVRRKTEAVVAQEMTAIVCCGETLDEREKGQEKAVVARQLREALRGMSNEQMKQIVIAYEPVWAIGTGKTATTAQAQEMHAFIRSVLAELFGSETAQNTSILYGGSCKPENAAELFACEDVDGGLIGGASLNATDFLAIANSFQH